MFGPRATSPRTSRSPRQSHREEAVPAAPEHVSPQRSPRMSTAELASPRGALSLLRSRTSTSSNSLAAPHAASHSSPTSPPPNRSPTPPPQQQLQPPPLPSEPPGYALRQWKVHLQDGVLASDRLDEEESGAVAEEHRAEEEDEVFEFSLSDSMTSGLQPEAGVLAVCRISQIVFGDVDERFEGLLEAVFGLEALLHSPEAANGMHWIVRRSPVEGVPVYVAVRSSEIVLLLQMQHVAAHAAEVQRKYGGKLARALRIIQYAQQTLLK